MLNPWKKRNPSEQVVVQANENTTNPDASASERRRERRYPTNEAAEVEVMFLESAIPATIVDVSRSGLRLQLQQPLGRGLRVKVTIQRQMMIFGEVRYCKNLGDRYYAGVQIGEVFDSRQPEQEHIQATELALYLAGKGLTTPEVMRLREHLLYCRDCRARLGESSSRKADVN